MPFGKQVVACPYCGLEITNSNIARHIKSKHAEERDRERDDVADGEEFTKDEQPQARRGRPRQTAKKAPRQSSGATIPLRAQLEIPYKLGATVAQARGYAITAAALRRQAPECAAAWDDFLYRWPAVREMLEKGAIGADVLRLFMAHWPILQAVREEQMRRVQIENAYGDQASGDVPAAA